MPNIRFKLRISDPIAREIRLNTNRSQHLHRSQRRHARFTEKSANATDTNEEPLCGQRCRAGDLVAPVDVSLKVRKRNLPIEFSDTVTGPLQKVECEPPACTVPRNKLREISVRHDARTKPIPTFKE